LQGPSTGDGKLFTQEFRIASPSSSTFEYTAGAFYSNQTNDTDPTPFSITVSPFPGVIIPDHRHACCNYSLDTKDESAAAFGQATYHVGDKLRLIGGARYTHEKLTVDYRSLTLAPPADAKTSIDNFSWKLGPQYQFDKNTMAYAMVSRGYKGRRSPWAIPAVPTISPR
jgi:iron complex outermembrane receptor protein